MKKSGLLSHNEIHLELTFKVLGQIDQLRINAKPTLVQRITTGCYTWTSKEITEEHFFINEPVDRRCMIELLSFHFTAEVDEGDETHYVKTDEVLSVMNKAKLRPIVISEVLAIGEKYPDLQKEFKIICLGSRYKRSDEREYCPYLDWDGRRRGLGIYRISKRWKISEGLVFGAVRF